MMPPIDSTGESATEPDGDDERSTGGAEGSGSSASSGGEEGSSSSGGDSSDGSSSSGAAAAPRTSSARLLTPREILSTAIKDGLWDRVAELITCPENRDLALCSVANADGELPLHEVMMRPQGVSLQQADSIQQLVGHFPAAAAQAIGPNGFTAFHLFGQLSFGDAIALADSILTALVKANPGGLLQLDLHGGTPLLWAVHEDNPEASTLAARALLHACPAAAAVAALQGNVPLHHCVGLHVGAAKWQELAKEVLEAAPQATRSELGLGFTPLHMACMNGNIRSMGGMWSSSPASDVNTALWLLVKDPRAAVRRVSVHPCMPASTCSERRTAAHSLFSSLGWQGRDIEESQQEGPKGTDAPFSAREHGALTWLLGESAGHTHHCEASELGKLMACTFAIHAAVGHVVLPEDWDTELDPIKGFVKYPEDAPAQEGMTPGLVYVPVGDAMLKRPPQVEGHWDLEDEVDVTNFHSLLREKFSAHCGYTIRQEMRKAEQDAMVDGSRELVLAYITSRYEAFHTLLSFLLCINRVRKDQQAAAPRTTTRKMKRRTELSLLGNLDDATLEAVLRCVKRYLFPDFEALTLALLRLFFAPCTGFGGIPIPDRAGGDWWPTVEDADADSALALSSSGDDEGDEGGGSSSEDEDEDDSE